MTMPQLTKGLARRVGKGGLWGAPLWEFRRITSTNTWLLDRGVLCRHGETARTQYQTAGRGRSGRAWYCGPEAGLAFSVAFRCSRCTLAPEYHGAVAALAVAACLENYGLKPRLKWPNDVLIGNRKVAGILGETRSDAPDVIVVGVGCNVNEQHADFAGAGLETTAISLALADGRIRDPGAVFGDMLCAWQRAVDRACSNGPASLAAQWRRRDALAGCRVTAENGTRRFTGVALGVDEDMALRIRDDDGGEQTYRSGEIVHIGSI